MNIHTDIGMLPAKRMLILDICQQLNVPLSRVIISHLDPSQLLQWCRPGFNDRRGHHDSWRELLL